MDRAEERPAAIKANSTMRRPKQSAPHAGGASLVLDNRSDLQNYRHDQRPPARALLDIPLQVSPDLLLDDTVVSLLLARGVIQRPLHHQPGLGNHLLIADRQTPHHNLRSILQLARPLV